MRGSPRKPDTKARASRARASWQIRPLSERQREVLGNLAAYKTVFVRPMDVGGRDWSHHAKTLMTLVGRELVETRKDHAIYCSFTPERPRKAGAQHCCCRGSRRYRITKAGIAALAAKETR